MSKTVELRGQKWVVRIDSCRFYIRPAEGNPLLDREECSCLEFKHDDGPASCLADALFASLPGDIVPDPMHMIPGVECPVHGFTRAGSIADNDQRMCARCEAEAKLQGEGKPE